MNAVIETLLPSFRALQVGDVAMTGNVTIECDGGIMEELPGTWAYNPETGIAYLLSALMGALKLSREQIALATTEDHVARQEEIAAEEFCLELAAQLDQAVEDRAEQWAAE